MAREKDEKSLRAEVTMSGELISRESVGVAIVDATQFMWDIIGKKLDGVYLGFEVFHPRRGEPGEMRKIHHVLPLLGADRNILADHDVKVFETVKSAPLFRQLKAGDIFSLVYTGSDGKMKLFEMQTFGATASATVQQMTQGLLEAS